jgi:hypothetical protein
MTKTNLVLSLLSFSIVLIFVMGIYQLQYASGIINQTSTACINGKCVTTMCIDNEPCRTITSNSTTPIPDDLTKNEGNNTVPSSSPLRTA